MGQPSRIYERRAGCVAGFQTPYREDESIDFEPLEREIDWLFRKGADGVVMAMVSEVLRLSEREREEMALRVCPWAQGRGAGIISLGAESTRQGVYYARHAEASGATAVMHAKRKNPMGDPIVACYPTELWAHRG